MTHPSSKQQLAAIDLVWQWAVERGMNGSKMSVVWSLMRDRALEQQERERRIGEAYKDSDAPPWLEGDALGAAIMAAVAEAGAEIVWPTPTDGSDRPAADATAPGTATPDERPADSVVRGLPLPDFLVRHLPVWEAHDCTCGVYIGRDRTAAGRLWAAHLASKLTNQDESAPQSAREKILTEVAACDEQMPESAHIYEIRDQAAARARLVAVADGNGVPVPDRANLIRAAALLLLAVERMDGAA